MRVQLLGRGLVSLDEWQLVMVLLKLKVPSLMEIKGNFQVP